jgi:hypothetical protein
MEVEDQLFSPEDDIFEDDCLYSYEDEEEEASESKEDKTREGSSKSQEPLLSTKFEDLQWITNSEFVLKSILKNHEESYLQFLDQKYFEALLQLNICPLQGEDALHILSALGTAPTSSTSLHLEDSVLIASDVSAIVLKSSVCTPCTHSIYKETHKLRELHRIAETQLANAEVSTIRSIALKRAKVMQRLNVALARDAERKLVLKMSSTQTNTLSISIVPLFQ